MSGAATQKNRRNTLLAFRSQNKEKAVALVMQTSIVVQGKMVQTSGCLSLVVGDNRQLEFRLLTRSNELQNET